MTPRRALTTAALTTVLVFVVGCSDDSPDTPTGDTSSNEVQGGTAVPGGSPRVNNNEANPDAPADPVGSAP